MKVIEYLQEVPTIDENFGTLYATIILRQIHYIAKDKLG